MKNHKLLYYVIGICITLLLVTFVIPPPSDLQPNLYTKDSTLIQLVDTNWVQYHTGWTAEHLDSFPNLHFRDSFEYQYIPYNK